MSGNAGMRVISPAIGKGLSAIVAACLAAACAPAGDGGEQERIRAEAPAPPADEDGGLTQTRLANGCFVIELKPSAEHGLAIPRQVVCPELPGFDVRQHAARHGLSVEE